MADPIRIGIIGCGRISYAHRDACERLVGEVALVAAADVEEGRLAKLCDGAAHPISIQSTDFHRLLVEPSLDAVIICLPHSLHHPVTLEALKAGKHVLVEKPMALSDVEAQEMAEAAARAKRTLMVGQCRRFSRAAIEMKRLVDSGEVGELFRVILNFLCFFETAPAPWWNEQDKAGSPFVTVLQGSHAFDEVLWLFGRMPVSVSATSSRRKFAGADEADVYLDYGNGSAAIHLSLNTPPPLIHEVIAVGTKGVVRLSESLTGKPFGFGYRLELNGKPLLEGPQEPTNFVLQLTEFVQSLREGREPIANGSEIAATTMRIIACCKEAVATRRSIPLETPAWRKGCGAGPVH